MMIVSKQNRNRLNTSGEVVSGGVNVVVYWRVAQNHMPGHPAGLFSMVYSPITNGPAANWNKNVARWHT
jgi:hypothetical protein